MITTATRLRWGALIAALGFFLLASDAKGVNDATVQIGLADVRATYPTLDGVDDITGAVQRVAIVDTGIDYDHPYLAGRVVAGYNVGSGAAYQSTSPDDYDDGHGHGTAVAGIIGSTRPDRMGLAPNVEFVAVRVLSDSGTGSFSDIASGLQWVADNAAALNITAVNMSLGSPTLYATEDQVPNFSAYNQLESAAAQLEAMDVILTAASGNDSDTAGLAVPAIYDETISVGAVNEDDSFWNRSNRSSELDLLAPGTGVSVLWKDGARSNGSGTSFAAPMVAGVSVLLREAYEQFTDDLSGDYDSFQDRLTDLLQLTADPIYDDATSQTYARINVSSALAAIYAEFNGSVPEPASMALLFVGAAAMLPNRRIRHTRRK